MRLPAARTRNISLRLKRRRGIDRVELASKVFELSQTLRRQWDTPDYDPMRRILEILVLNCRPEGAILVPTISKPFDVFAVGPLVSSTRCDRI